MKERLSDKACVKLAKKIAKDRSWVNTLPKPKGAYPGQFSPYVSRAWKTCRAHRPGDRVLVNDPKAHQHKPRYLYYYVGTYSTGHGGAYYGHYRLLRNDGKLISCGTIVNLDKKLRQLLDGTEPNGFDWRPNEVLPEDQ